MTTTNGLLAWFVPWRINVISVVVFVALSLLFYATVIDDELDDLARSEAKIAKQKEILFEKSKLAANLDSYRAQRVAVGKAAEPWLLMMPDRIQLAYSGLFSAAQRHDVRVDMIKVADATAKGPYTMSMAPALVILSGRYHAIGKTLAELASFSPPIVFDEFALIPVGGDQLRLEARARAVRYLTESELAAAAAASKKRKRR